jgi:hypothetical protein
MKVTSIYAKVAQTATFTVTFAALAMTALAASTAQARPQYIQDVQYVQGGAQLVITPPQLVIQAPLPPVYVAPVEVHRPRPVVIAPVVAPVAPPVYVTKYVPGRIYYINGRAYLNGHPYVRGHAYGHYKVKHHKRHHDRDDRWDRHYGRHGEGRHVGPRH